MNPWLAALLGLVFPGTKACPLCHAPLPENVHDSFCPVCVAEFSLFQHPLCSRCGAPLTADGCCVECTGEDFPFRRAYAVGPFAGNLREAVLEFKYGKRSALARPLAGVMADWWLRHGPQAPYDLLIPVPLHAKRQRERGFNQAELLAVHLSGPLRIPVAANVVRRVRATSTQAAQTAAERAANLAGAFACINPAAVRGKSVLLIDDVFTTGSTLRECAKTLLDAGAKEVAAFCLCRTLKKRPERV